MLPIKKLKRKMLLLVATMFIIPPIAWFAFIRVSSLVDFEEWGKLLFDGSFVWGPYVIFSIGLIIYLSNIWMRSVEEVLINPDISEEIKEKARVNISSFPMRLFVAEIIYGFFGPYMSIFGYFVLTGQQPPMMDERLLSAGLSGVAVILFVAIPFIFIIANVVNHALKIIGVSKKTARFTIEKQFFVGSFALSFLAVLSIVLFYYGQTRLFNNYDLIFVLFLIIVCLGFNKLIAGYISSRLNEILFVIEKIKENDFSQKVEIRSSDEIGLLSDAFNDMAEYLSNYTKRLEEEVNVRTKELDEKLIEAEQINRLMVGRELKMIELKQEIEKLKINRYN